MTKKKQNEIELSEKTCQIFNAPWVIEEEAPLAWYCVIDSKDSVIANDVRDKKTVNRLARLPELYAALKEAAYEKCHACIEFSSEDEYVPPSEEFVEHGCPKKSKTCFCCKWWTLLKQVRDGK